MALGWRGRFGVAGLVLLAIAVLGWNQVLTLRAQLLTSQAELAEAFTMLSDSPLSSLTLQTLDESYQHLIEAEASALAVEEESAGLLRFSPALGWLPWVGAEIQAAPHLVSLSLSLSRTGRALLDAARPLVLLAEEGPEALPESEEAREEKLRELALGRLRLEDAAVELGALEVTLAILEELPVAPRLAGDLQQVRDSLPTIRALLDAGPVLLGLAEVLVYSAAFFQGFREFSANPGGILDDEAAWSRLKSQIQEFSRALERQPGIASSPSSLDSSIIGPQAEMESFIRLVRQAASGTEALFESVGPLRELMTRDDFRTMTGQRFNPDLLEAIHQAGPSFQRAQDAYGDTRALLGSLRGQGIASSIRPFVGVLEGTLDRLYGLTKMGTVGARLLPLLMGEETIQNILVIPQNADELRATGGFIVGSWIITMDRGTMTRLQFVDNYDVDYRSPRQTEYFTPPEDMVRSQWAGTWLFIDANWLPDYPDTARMAQEMFYRGQGIRPDTVFALDQYGMRDLVDALGPLEIPGGGGRITGDNFLAVMEMGTDAESHIYMDKVFQSLIDRLQEQTRPSQLFGLLLALERNLEQKHLLFFFNDLVAQQLVAGNNWGGAIRQNPGDYLYVVDTNLGFDKANRSVEQAIQYDVVISSEGSAEAQLDVQYVNNSLGRGERCIQTIAAAGSGYAEEIYNCYWNYLRIYVPEDIQLLSASPLPWPETSLYILAGNRPDEETTLRVERESNRTKLGSFFVAPRGETRNVTFRYALPLSTVRRDPDGTWTYSLYLQKQPGTHGNPVTVRIRLPGDARVVYAEPQPTRSEGAMQEFGLLLERDTRITLRFQPYG